MGQSRDVKWVRLSCFA